MAAHRDVARLALDLVKATFDNTYASLATLQELLEDRASSLARGAAWMPDQVKDVVGECVGFLRRTRLDFKETVDRCHLLLADLAGPADDRRRPGSDETAAGAPRRSTRARSPAAVH